MSPDATCRNLEYLDLDYFAVLPEDYNRTLDRPKCEKKPSDEHYSKLVRGACLPNSTCHMQHSMR